MENEELVRQIQEGVNVQENIGTLYNQNVGLIRKWCLPFSERADMDDLMQEAYFGMVEAVETFNFEVGTRFTTHLQWRIRKVCVSYVHKHGNVKRIPEHMQERLSKYRKLIKTVGKIPEKEYVMEQMGLTSEQYDLMILTAYQENVICIDQPISDDGKMVADLIADDTNIEEEISSKISCEDLWDQVQTILDRRKNNIIVKSFKFDQSLTEIAKEEGISVQYCSALKFSALKQLKKMDAIQCLAEEYGYDSIHAYSGHKNSTEFLALKHIEIEKEYNRLMEGFSVIMSNVG